MNEIEQSKLQACECVIERGLKTFVEVGTALMQIRDDRLYLGSYATFEDYCRERWHLGQSRVYQMIDAAKVVDSLKSSTMVELPTSERQTRPLTTLKEPEHQRAAWQIANETAQENNEKVTARHVEEAVQQVAAIVSSSEPAPSPELVKFFGTPAAEQDGSELTLAVVEAPPAKIANPPKFNRTNDNVEWARWTWNPVTGCLHNCPYCYARDIANRFYTHLPEGDRFKPVFYEERLAAPRYMKVPEAAKDDVGEKNVFVCSMADLWGKWVPTEWIERVLAEVEASPQWNFLFLTKFPARYEEFAGRIPANAWIGTTVDRQHAVQRAEKAFAKVQAAGHQGLRWLSCEPMLERLTFERLDMFDWVVVGGSSKSTQTPEFYPPMEWTLHLWQQATAADCAFYMKTNLVPMYTEHGRKIDIRVREYPWSPGSREANV